MKFKTLPLSIAVLLSANAFAKANDHDLPAMVVSADFRPAIALETPVSLTTIDSETIDSRGAQHVEDILNLAPNVNLSAGASRGQFFQIRGIGERSQFTAPINPSVGLYIDGIDLSRNGSAATLFDIERVEVLRGPQGTLYGANALAGVINLQSTQPTQELDIHFETGLAEYDTRNVGLAVGGSLVENTLLGRFSIYSHRSDGYTDNDFLNRDNTQRRDELTVRGHLKWLITDDLTVDLNVLHLNFDNGYDAFSLANSRDTVSDEPGKDMQRTRAIALKTDWRVNDKIQVQSSFSYSLSDLEYSYDDDWSFQSEFAPGLFPYSGFDQYLRQRENYALESKVLSNENGKIFNNTTSWTIGLYHAEQKQGLDRNYFDNDTPAIFPSDNDYETQNTAVYGQLETGLTEQLTLISGLRVENSKADFTDSAGLDLTNNDVLFGGKLGLQYDLNSEHMIFSTLSRGFKAGGINDDTRLVTDLRRFDSEYLWNLEGGLKSSWLDGELITNLTAFYTLRKNAQLKTSIGIPRSGGGTRFIDYLDNADKVTNIGIEADLDWLVNKNFRVLASLGLLDTDLHNYKNPELLSEGISLRGRRIAHAPSYQFSIGGEWYISNNLTFKANVEGKDEFYFSNSHNFKSGSYAITNASLNYELENWTISLWGKNLFDKDYGTRGFEFGIDPSLGYADGTYTQKGDPRVVGLTLSWDY